MVRYEVKKVKGLFGQRNIMIWRDLEGSLGSLPWAYTVGPYSIGSKVRVDIEETLLRIQAKDNDELD